MARVEWVGMLIGWQEFLHLAHIWQINITRNVRDEETVLADHLGQKHTWVFTDSIGNQVIIKGFLCIARPAHQPTHVARRKRIGMLGAEVTWRIESAVGDHHLHRHTAARNRGIELVCELHTYAGAAREN